MNAKPYILSVDDEAINQEIIKDLLEEEYAIDALENGQACLDSVEEKIPDLILLDVNMPVLNGLKTCEQLRAKDSSQNIPIIFVSALSSPTERLEGYQAGADDYLSKPFDEDELKTKIKLLLKQNTDLQAAHKDKKFATDTAMCAMSSASEIGVAFQFMREILNIKDQDTLHKLIIETLNSYNLSGCIMLTHLQEPVYLFSDGIEKQIEKDVLREAHQKGRVIEFSRHAIFNSDHAAIVIRQMPKDEDIRGRFRDHLLTLMDALESKLQQIMLDNESNHHYQLLATTIDAVANKLQHVRDMYADQRRLSSTILGQLVQDVEGSFLTLGLDEEQERAVVQHITNTEKESDLIYENGQQTTETFNKIITDLSGLLK